MPLLSPLGRGESGLKQFRGALFMKGNNHMILHIFHLYTYELLDPDGAVKVRGLELGRVQMTVSSFVTARVQDVLPRALGWHCRGLGGGGTPGTRLVGIVLGNLRDAPWTCQSPFPAPSEAVCPPPPQGSFLCLFP